MKPVSPRSGDQAAPGQRWLITRTALPMCLVLLIYLWFISAGLWSTWPKTAVYDYYSNLAAAFLKGQLHLQDQPSPELLALPDPYRISARKNVEHIWDATLYEGRYYLYWGPVPALTLVPVRLLFGVQTIPDLYLAFGFVVGMFLILCLILWRVWVRFFSELPPWTLSLSIIIAGLAPPLTWMLNRPEVYEAALAAGQFFILGCLYLCFSAMDGAPHVTGRLALASLSLGLAIGCRTSEAIPAAFIVLVMTVFILQQHRTQASHKLTVAPLVALWVPMAVLTLMLLWYNNARFGSMLEFGYRFQLTLLQMPKHYDELFSMAYVLPNLYNYILNPFTLAQDFPPIRPQYGRTDLGPGIAFPGIYFSEAVTGLVFTFPFMIFAAGMLFESRAKPGRVEQAREGRDKLTLRWLVILVLGVLALEFGELLLFFFATERYLAEMLPSLTLVACIGWWRIWLAAKSVPNRVRWISMVAVVLALASMTSTTLLAISSYQERLREFNPGLIAFINGVLQR